MSRRALGAAALLLLGSCYRSHELTDPGTEEAVPVWFLHTIRPVIEGGRYELRAARVGDTEDVRTLGRSLRLPLVQWKPNGESIVLIALGPTFPAVMDLSLVTFGETGAIAQRRVATELRNPSDLAWSSDGAYFAYLTDSVQLRLHVHEANGAEIATHVIPRGDRGSLQWLAETDQLLLSWREEASRFSRPNRLSVARAADGFVPEALALERPEGTDEPPDLRLGAVSESGRWIQVQLRGRSDGSFLSEPWIVHLPSGVGTRLEPPAEVASFGLASGADRVESRSGDAFFAARLGEDGRLGGWEPLGAEPLFWLDDERYVGQLIVDGGGVVYDWVVGSSAPTERFRGPERCTLRTADRERGRYLFDCGDEDAVWWDRSTGEVIALPPSAAWDTLGQAPTGERALLLIGRGDVDRMDGRGETLDLHEIRIPPDEPSLVHEDAKDWTRTSLGAASPWSPFGDAYYFLEQRGGLFVRDLVADEVFTIVEPDDTFLVQGFGFERRTR